MNLYLCSSIFVFSVVKCTFCKYGITPYAVCLLTFALEEFLVYVCIHASFQAHIKYFVNIKWYFDRVFTSSVI